MRKYIYEWRSGVGNKERREMCEHEREVRGRRRSRNITILENKMFIQYFTHNNLELMTEHTKRLDIPEH